MFKGNFQENYGNVQSYTDNYSSFDCCSPQCCCCMSPYKSEPAYIVPKTRLPDYMCKKKKKTKKPKRKPEIVESPIKVCDCVCTRRRSHLKGKPDQYMNNLTNDSLSYKQTHHMRHKLPEPGSEAFEEITTCLNGSSLTLRVLKDNRSKQNSANDCDLDKIETESLGSSTCASASLKDISDHISDQSSEAKEHSQKRKSKRKVNKSKSQPIFSEYIGIGEGNLEVYSPSSSNINNGSKSMSTLVGSRKKGDGDLDNIIKACCFKKDVPENQKKQKAGAGEQDREGCYKVCGDPYSDTYLIQLSTKKCYESKEHKVDIELKMPNCNKPDSEVCIRQTQIKGPKLDRAVARCRLKPKKPPCYLWPSDIPMKRYKKFLKTNILYRR